MVNESRPYQDSSLVQEARIPGLAKLEEEKYDGILKECKQYLQESGRLRSIATRRSEGSTRTNRINPIRISKQQKLSRTEGIDEAEIQRWKAKGECLRSAWPSHRKGAHQVNSCIRPIKLEKGTASYPMTKEYQKLTQSQQQPLVEEESSHNTSSEVF